MTIRSLRPLLVLLLLAGAPTVHAQDDDDLPALSSDRLQELKAQKAAFITQRLGLTPEEAQAFWPLYNKYEQELEAARKRSRGSLKDAKANTELTAADAERVLDGMIAARQQEVDVRKQYSAAFRRSIGAVKTLRLAQAEREFNRELLKRIRSQGPDRERGPSRRP